MIVTLPAAVPVVPTEQVPPAERVQVGGEESVTPPEPPGWTENVTVSPVMVPFAPATVAVHEVVPPNIPAWPIPIGDVHATAVVVAESAVGEYLKLVTAVAVLPYPPQVAFTV